MLHFHVMYTTCLASHYVSYVLLPYFFTYLLIYCLIECLTYLIHGTVLLEKLTGFQLFKKLPSFYGTRVFITALTSARHLSLS